MKDEILETVSDTKLLGVHITSDLKWNKNTEEIIKKANKRMFLLHNVSKFTSKISDLTTVYKIFIRSILENSCVVWHSSLSEQNSSDIERIQKSACKVILKDYYSTYESALKLLKLETLKTRREKLCKSFAQKCTRNVKVKSMFPKNTCKRQVRNQNKYFVNFATTERYLKSSIPYMQRMLNSEHKQKSELIRFRGL